MGGIGGHWGENGLHPRKRGGAQVAEYLSSEWIGGGVEDERRSTVTRTVDLRIKTLPSPSR